MEMPLVFVPHLKDTFEVYGTVYQPCSCGADCGGGTIYFVVARDGFFEEIPINECQPVPKKGNPVLVATPVTATPPPKFSVSDKEMENVLKEVNKKVWPDKKDREDKIERFKKRVEEAGQKELAGTDVRAAMMLFYDGGKQG